MRSRTLAGTLALATLVLLGSAGCSRTDRSAPPAVRSASNVSAQEVAPPAGDFTNPHARDSAAATLGAKLFTGMNCDGCHGGGAVGSVGPSLSDGRWRYGGSDGEVFQSIYYGRPRGMPAFGGILGQDQIWSLVSYIRSLPTPSIVPTESWVEEDR